MILFGLLQCTMDCLSQNCVISECTEISYSTGIDSYPHVECHGVGRNGGETPWLPLGVTVVS